MGREEIRAAAVGTHRAGEPRRGERRDGRGEETLGRRRAADGGIGEKPLEPQTGRAEAVFVVQGGLNDPAHRRIAVNMEQALSQTIEQSSTVAQTVQQTRQQTMELEQSRAEAMDMDGPKGPVMRMGARTMSSQNSDMGDGGGGGGGG